MDKYTQQSEKTERLTEATVVFNSRYNIGFSSNV